MPPEAISVRVPDDLLAAVDTLVQSGAYTGRSDFIVKAVRRAVGPAPAESGSTKNILLLPFRPDPWPATAAKNLAPHPAGLDWLLDEMGVITLHAGAPSTKTICVLPTLGRDGYRVCNLWYRYLSGTATPGVHAVQPGGEVDLLPSPGKNHPLDLWDHPEANGASLDYNDRSGTTPVLRALPVLRAPNVIYAGLEAQGAPGSFVSFQFYAVVERVASRVPGSPGRARTPGPYAVPADSRDVQAEGPRGLSPSEVAELQAKTLEAAAASLVANSTGRAQDVALCAQALRVRADAFRTRTVLESRLLEERSEGIMPARGETRRPAEPECADEGTSAWVRTSRGRFVREEIPRGYTVAPGEPKTHAAVLQQGASGDWLWQTFRARSRVPTLRSEGREASSSLAMEKADAALAWDGWELPEDVGEIVESAGSVVITRDATWEDGFRKRIDAGMDATWGEHRGVWYQGSALHYEDGSRHYLINHVDGELGKLGGVYATEAHVIAAIDGYLDTADLLER